MNNIKIGDKVIYNSASRCDMTQGKTYTVIRINQEDGYTTVFDDAGDVQDLTTSDFTLSELPTHKLKVSIEGFGTSYSKEKEVYIEEGRSIVDLISKLNDL